MNKTTNHENKKIQIHFTQYKQCQYVSSVSNMNVALFYTDIPMPLPLLEKASQND
jgi:hypothetical protein